jgi:N-acetylglucosamine-6-sulfatase
VACGTASVRRHLPTSNAQSTVTSGQPMNFVVIITDDQRWDTLWAMPTVQHELVSRGVTFSNGFVTTPLCCPSRASILSGGFYAHHTGVLQNGGPNGGAAKFSDVETLATWLHDAGWKTALIGKYFNHYDQLSPYVPPGWTRWVALVRGGYFSPYINIDGVETTATGYQTKFWADQAVQFIRQYPDTPIFLYLTPFAPHEPAIPALRDRSAFSDFPPWRPPSYNEEDVSDKPRWVRRLPPLSPDVQVAQDEFDRNQLRTLQAVDRAVGSIVEALGETERLANTVFVLTSDNGLMWGEHRVLDKGCVYEECIRVPFVVVVPGVAARTDPHLVLNLDIGPTIAALAGLTKSTDGQNLLPLLRDPQVSVRDDFLIEYWGERLKRFRAVRNDRWKYVEYANGDRELYDLSNDPYELDNQVNNPAYRETVASLQSRLQQISPEATEPQSIEPEWPDQP